MAQFVVDDPHGFETIFSTDPTSRASPYLREYHPQSLEDLYDIGVIPKHVPVHVLREAKKAGLHAGARYMNIDSPTVRNLPTEARRQYVEAQSNTSAREISVRATAAVLVAQHGFAVGEADLLARKAHTFGESDRVNPNRPVPFYSVLLADDLVVKTRLVIQSSVQCITAKAVIIHRSGEIRIEGTYFLLRCDSIQGEGYWFDRLHDRDLNPVVSGVSRANA